ncbi:MAG: lamin tail domain-containing protein [Tepidisphaeraceae bacterium]|jgi:hypothetical protein
MRTEWRILAACAAASWAGAAWGNVYITKFCSDTGNNELFEFVQVTNLGSTPVNMSGWSEDDSHDTPDVSGHSLTGLGILQPGESGIITQATPANFISFWGAANLPANLPIVGPYTNDELNTDTDSIYLFNSARVAVDQLDYSTTNGGSADSVVRNAPLDALGFNDNELWANSFLGDDFGSFRAAQQATTIGNPGYYMVPEPTGLGVLGLGWIVGMRRRRNDKVTK